ncbi:RNase P subunit p30-domain-containing protein [Syncephalastrum racemosum]|uniref:RNase P subunit p30-domain-containing protein n=1 Tax=Syncephalastrum racemosum TaxID=13706 RepID=A0A1X2H744_SYNRA|nr:RNase P subunit p30-domain-containing protein [Syncephalastrum racemosum]
MYYDLNIPYPREPEREDLDRLNAILERVQSIQRATIALNLTINEPFTRQSVEPLQSIRTSTYKDIKQLRRVTVFVQDAKKNLQLVYTNPAHPHVDILAVRPANADICRHACQTYDIDLISLDCTNKFQIPNHASFGVAKSRGIFFEICYGQIWRPHTDKEGFRETNFFGNVKRLVETSRGENLIFSSEALKALDIRRPSDLKMLGIMFGLTERQVEAATSYNYRRLLNKAETRRATVLGAVRFDPIAADESNNRKRKTEEEEKSEKTKKAKAAS